MLAALQRLKGAYRDGQLLAATEAFNHVPPSFSDDDDDAMAGML